MNKQLILSTSADFFHWEKDLINLALQRVSLARPFLNQYNEHVNVVFLLQTDLKYFKNDWKYTK